MNGLQHRVLRLYQLCRMAKFRLLWDCRRVEGLPSLVQPALFLGKGTIRFHGNVKLGYFPSPYFLNGYIHVEARSEQAVIEFGDGVVVNNSSVIVSDGAGIKIGARTMFGTHCEVIDSDFHDLHPDRRTEAGKTAKVDIGENVLIGSNVRILKGVRIGKNAVIANGTIVSRSIPEGGLAFPSPVKVGFPMVQA
jgi:acetyltransferase-like isoleucine patch superfamily enzyme